MESKTTSRSRTPNYGKKRSSKSSTGKKVSSQTDKTHTLPSGHEVKSKSTAGFSNMDKKNTKQAWAAPPKNNLSRSPYSYRRSEPSLPKSEPIFSKSRTSLFKTSNGSTFLMVNNELSSSEKFGGTEKDEEFRRAEDHIFLQDLFKLRKKFEEADVDGNGTLDINEFLTVFDQLFGLKGKKEAEILTFFNKIDYNCDNCIDWDEFCTYMYLEYQERDLVDHRSKKVTFHLPAQSTVTNPHNDSLCRITHLTDGSLVTCSTDGVLCFWTNDFSPRRVRKTEPGHIGKPMWVTDMALCIPQSKILITTGDREIQFYEMMNFEPYCQLRRLESVPLRVAFWYNPAQHSQCVILLGDKEGTLTVITTDNIQEAFKHWKLGTKGGDGMPTYPIHKLTAESVSGTSIYRWKLHSNWVTEVHYFPSLRCFASCSSDPMASLVLGSPTGSTQVDALLQTTRQLSVLSSGGSGRTSAPLLRQKSAMSIRPKSSLPAKTRMSGDQRVFRVPKGVSTVDYCHKNNALVTGSTDQIIRIWNPFINTKPIAHLYGQGAPVFSVKVDSEENRILSIGNDNNIKVWHTLDHTCLFNLTCGAHKVYATVQTFHFNPISRLIALGTDQLSILNFAVPKQGRADITQSHTHPVTTLKYSHCFDQIVTACEGALLKVWDIYTGTKMFEYSADLGEDVGVSTLDVDLAGKRVVTGGQNGQIKVWNYNNGHCVCMLDKGNSSEVSDIRFVSINNNRYIIAVGWDRKVSLFPDTPSRHANSVVKPVEAWSNASERAHSEDILCVAFGSPHLMATASFDGEIIVWSMISCHVFSHLKVPSQHSTTPLTASTNEAVHKVLFLDTRSKSRTAANLVASGPAGYIHFWNVYDTSGPMGTFCASTSSVTSMAANSANTVLVTAETHGHICVWNITGYCMTTRHIQPPDRVALWRAHSDTVTCIELVEERGVIVSAATDGTVRLWTLEGHYVGTFGQKENWTLGDPSTYQHPLTPKDALASSDITSLTAKVTQPSKPSPDEMGDSADAKRDVVGGELAESMERSTVTEEMEVIETESDSTSVVEEQDEDVLLQSHISVNIPIGERSAGKRLRHLRSNSAIQRRPGKSPSSVYTSLPYHHLNEETHSQMISNCFAPIRGSTSS